MSRKALAAALRLIRPGGLHLIQSHVGRNVVTVNRRYPVTGVIGSRFMSEAKDGSSTLPPLVYEDSFIKETLGKARTIAMVGASTNWARPSFFAMKYLQVGNTLLLICFATAPSS